MSNKRWWLRFHVWLGISVGLFWALQGLSGALLVFNRDIQGAAYASRAEADAVLPLDAIFARASAAAHHPVTRIEAFGARPFLFLAYYEADGETRTLVVDGRDGRALDDRAPEALLPRGSGFWPWLLRFHEGLLGGDSGQMVVGTSGILLLLSLAIGLWNAWPRRGQWRAAFRTRLWRTSRQKLWGWHRMLGLVAVLPLLAVASCGIYLAFAPELRPVLARHAGYVLPFSPKKADSAPVARIGIGQAWRVVEARFPGAEVVRAIRPSAKSPFYVFRLLQKQGEWRRWAGTSWAAVDPATGRLVASYDSLKGPLANRLTDNLYPVHTGEVGGVPLRILVLLAGLQLPVFFVTGLLLWRRRRPAKLPERNFASAPQAAE